jgi:hypothetical protein
MSSNIVSSPALRNTANRQCFPSANLVTIDIGNNLYRLANLGKLRGPWRSGQPSA